MKTAVTMKSYDRYRSTLNPNETILTASNVQKLGLKHLFDCMLPGDFRGSENQPLIVPDLVMSDGDKHDVMFVATMNNDAYAFDATTPDPETGQGRVLWKQTIGHPITNDLAHDMYRIADHWGTTSTGVIDLVTQTWYLIAMTSPDGSFTKAIYKMHALDLLTGADKCPPLDLSSATYIPPDGLPKIVMGSALRKQRSALLFDSRNGNDTVFFGDSTFSMMSNDAHGFFVAVNVTKIRTMPSPKIEIAATLTTTCHYPGSGVWMASQGLSMDDAGFLYAATANGAFDGKYDFAESLVKIQYTPPSSTSAGKLQFVDWWAGYTDAFRQSGKWYYPWTGLIGKLPDPDHMASMKMRKAPDMVMDMSDMQMDKPMPDGMDDMKAPDPNSRMAQALPVNAMNFMTAKYDQDLGCAGAPIIPRSYTGFTKDLLLGCGKDGVLYVADPNNLGKTTLADFAPDKIMANWGKLLCPPYGFTFYPGNMNLTPVDVSTLQTTEYGFTHHNHGPVGCYRSPDHGVILYVWGENGTLRAINISQDAQGKFSLKYLGQSEEYASPNVTTPPGGMPGGMISLSCNANVKDTAVVWASVPWNDANKEISPGRLLAYGANWVDPKNGGTLVKIWDSRDWGIQFMHAKFNVITIANGKLYMCTYDGRVMVFGLGTQ
jgi:hypothetical protein